MLIVIFALGEPAIPPVATSELSKYNWSPFEYAEPPWLILKPVRTTDPPLTVKSAVAPFQVAVAGWLESLNSLMLKYVPFVWPLPPVSVPVKFFRAL